LRLNNTAANPQFHLTSADNGISELKFGDQSDLTRAVILYRSGSAGDALCFNGYNNTERLRITSDGNIGINDTAPPNFTGYKSLSIHGSTGGALVFGDDGTDEWEIYGGDGVVKIYDRANTQERIRISDNGEIGLGGANYGSSGQVLTSGGSGSAATWSTITGTTINSNSDNRVITGSGTANTLNAESTFVHDPVNCDTKIMHNSNNPADLLVQNDSTGTGANARLTLQSGSNSNAGAMFGMITGSHAWYLQTPKNAGNLEFQKGGLKFRMDNSGDFLINDGNLVIGTAGHGIDFSADGSGTLKTLPNSLNAELLHDYENGTFTPSIQYDTGTNHYSGSNVSSAVGEYIRIGDLVSFGMKIILTGNRNYSQNIYMYIGGLPYNGMHTSQQSSMMSGWGGWVCPTNDSNSSYQVHNCKHSYTTVDVRFEQSSGTGGIDGFYAWGFYRTAP